MEIQLTGKMKPKRPIVRYHGGKWLLGKWIISNFPPHRVYTEPFGGGGSVLLQKHRSYSEVYNDLDDEIVNLFQVVRDHGETLTVKLKNTPYSRKEFETSYNDCDDPVERARRTVIRSFMGFGSGLQYTQKTGFRSNSNRYGTTPAHDWKNYPDALEFIINRIQGVVIENRDYKEVILQQDSTQTLHYLDPPYMLDTRFKGQKTNVYRHEMTDEDHEDMLEFINQVKGTVVLSGYENDMYNNYLNRWEKVTKNTHADGAKPRTEVLYINRRTPNLFDLIENQ